MKKLDTARFTDTSRSLIRYEWDDKKADMHYIEHVTFNPEDKTVKQILKQFTIEDLEKNYVEFNKHEAEGHRYMTEFITHYDALTAIIDKRWNDIPEGYEIGAGQVMKQGDISLESIKEVGNDQEKFFKLKLEIFELQEVKNSKNRQWKAKMRKATTTLELLALLYEVYSTLENEEGERQD